MENSKNLWFKVASFFGAGILVFLGFVIIASGIILITKAETFNGVLTIVGGLICIALAVIVYKNYEKKSREALPGVKIEDLKKNK